jgi:Transglutaminase-like superfamily
MKTGMRRTINYLSSPDDLYRLDRSFLKNINKAISPELQQLVDSLCRNAHTDEEKARKIYGWVQQNIKYIAFEQGMEGFVPRDANLICNRRFGDCKDMSSILTFMLRTAGVQAYYTWVGTRDLPYTYTETPLPLVDNHMICTIRLGDKYIFLDGTDPTCVFGMPTEFIQDKQALVAIDDSSYKILTVPVMPKETNRLTDSTWLELTDQGLKGKIRVDLTGYYSMRLQGILASMNEKDYEGYMKNRFFRGSNKFHLDSFRVIDLNDKGHIRLTASFTLQDYAKYIDNEWYLNLNLFKFYVHDEIDYPKRKMPIEYNFLDQRNYTIALKIPDSYKVGYLPAGKSYHNAVWGFDLGYDQKGDELILKQEFDNDHLMLQPDQFADWNKVLENLFPLYKETVTLSKK